LADALFGDRDWFAEHRGRNHRIRPAAEGEFGYPATHTIVRQVLPGTRKRWGVYLLGDAAQSFEHIEAIAAAAADEVIGTFLALLERDGRANVADAVALVHAQARGTA
jgi:hypothetical protein